MTLKRLLLGSSLLFLFIISAVNFAFMYVLTEQIHTKLGEAAFSISRSTAESMLKNPFEPELIMIRSESVINSATRNVARLRSAPETQSNTERLRVPPPPLTSSREIRRNDETSVETENEFDHLQRHQQMVRVQRTQFQNEVNLSLENQKDSRSIILTRNATQFEIPIPRTSLENIIKESSNQLYWFTLFIFLLAGIFFYWLSQRLTKPLSQLDKTSQQIGAGDFGVQIKDIASPSTELTNLVHSVNKMSAHLKQLDQEKKQWMENKATHEIAEIARGLAHSIRNPLHTMMLSLGLLDDDSEKTSTAKATLRKQIDLINQHITNLMTITSYDSITIENIDLIKLTHECCEEIRCQFPAITITVNNQLNDTTFPIVRHEIQTILLSLLVNAAEAINGRNDGKILIEISHQEQAIAIQVRDNGKGLDPHIQAKLFEPHVTTKSHGMGMGLYLSKRILKGRYNGSIRCDESSPDGCTFTVSFGKRLKSIELLPAQAQTDKE